MLRGINRGFPGLFPTRRKVVYVFRTRLPVASDCIATPLLPHDLHVLSLPLAFILSQDQTLHCKCCLISGVKFSREINVVNRYCYAKPYRKSQDLRIAASKLSKIFSHLCDSVFFERSAKVSAFAILNKLILVKFSKFFSPK